MKKLLTSLFALAVMATASAQVADGARVYAYGLTQTEGENVTVSFKTNVTAKTAKVVLSAEGQDDVTVDATSSDGKNWTAIVKPSTLFAADVAYNWKAEVSNDAIASATCVFTKAFNRPSALSVDKNPESGYFGNVYISENVGYSSGTTTTGLYAGDAALTELTVHSIDKIVGDGSTRSSLPRSMSVASNGKIVVSACDETVNGIYTIDPSDYSVAEVLTGKKVFGVGAKGEDIYYVEANADNSGYNISSTNKDFTSIASSIKDYGNYAGHNAIAPIEQGMWVYFSDVNGADANQLHFIDYSGNIKWSVGEDNKVGTERGAMAVDEKSGLVVYYSKANGFILYNYSFDSTGALTVGDKQTMPNSVISAASGTRSEAMAFDYAGNLYVVSSGAEWLKVIAMPTENNTCATPAKKDMTVSFTQLEIEATGVETIGADNAPVEYYNLQGVKVENPENGIFIKKQGNKAVKVIL